MSGAVKAIARVILLAVLASGIGCARSDWIDRTLVTVDVTGIWEGGVAGYGGSFRFDLAQQGSQVKGTVGGLGLGRARSGGRIEGTVAGDVFTFRMPDTSFVGEMKVSEDEMTGQIAVPQSGARGTLVLRRVGSPTPPRLPKP
jgi:hypothetical protein